jgi:hypothetical protein
MMSEGYWDPTLHFAQDGHPTSIPAAGLVGLVGLDGEQVAEDLTLVVAVLRAELG